MTLIADLPSGQLLRAADAARVRNALENSVSGATKTAYSSDWRAFTGWCETSGLELTRALLGESFTTATAAQLARELAAAAGRPEPITGNLGRDLAKNTMLTKTAPAAAPAGRGRPAAAWSWS